MNTIKFLFILALASSALLAAILIIYAGKRHNVPAANYFIVLMGLAILYDCTYLLEINSSTLSEALIWFNVEHIPIPLLLYTWFVMGLEYVRLPKKQASVLKCIMLYHPISNLIIFFSNPIHQLYASSFRFQSNGYFPVLFYNRGLLYVFVVISGSFVGILSTAFYVLGYIKAPRLQRGGYLIMIIASLFPWSGVYLNIAGISPLGIDFFPIFSILSGVLYMFGIFQFRIFNTLPIATETVFRQAKEGILLIDWNDHVIDVNEAFLSLYPELNKLSKKHTFSAFVKSHCEFDGLPADAGKVSYRLIVNGVSRHYTAELEKIFAEDNRLVIGKILTLSDITLFVEYQKKLEDIASEALRRAETTEISFLQAQIKPHFLNNTLSVIASMITRDPQEAKVLITELGEYLASCYFFDDSSPMVALAEELNTVQTYVNIEKARFRERLNFTLDCAQLPKISVPRLVIQPLVENAIRHGILKKANGGNVWLMIRYDNETVTFKIQDDGVGMDAFTVKHLLEDAPGESGIGIANINRRLSKYYGTEIKIESALGQGTTVTVQIPYIVPTKLKD